MIVLRRSATFITVAPSPLHIRLLGGLQFSQNGKLLSGFVTTTAQALLAYLVVTGYSHSQEHLASLFWGDLSAVEAKANLRRVLLNLRKLVGIHIVLARDSVAFNPSAPYWCDIGQFEHILTQEWVSDIRSKELRPRPTHDSVLSFDPHTVRHHAPHQFAAMIDAVELYQGEFLAGLHIAGSAAFDAWLIKTREHLQQLALAALTKLVLHYGAQGEKGRGLALRYARRILTIDPLSEEAYREVMILLAKGGQHSAALAQYETCCRLLQRELGRPPMRETVVLYERIRAAAIIPRHTLPPSNTLLVGRERELSDLSDYIAMPNCPLIGIIGPDGAGKTRLAVEAGLRCGDQFADGVYFVALSSLNTLNTIITAIAEGVGCVFRGTASPKAQLLRHLGALEALIILDGAEQLLEAANNHGSPLLADLIVHAPGIKILVTAREAFGLAPENTLSLSGLSYPQPNAPCADVASCVAAYPAIRLFLLAAQRANEDYELYADQLTHVARLCRVLNGLPMAIEIAAAWASVLLVDEMANEMARNLDFLNDQHVNIPILQHVLRAAFEYAWSRLTAEDKSTLRKLSVFRGNFTRDAVEQIVGANRHTLLSLVDRSLVHRDASGRYVLHETLRQFAQEQLRLQPEEGSVTLQRYAEYYSRYVKAREAALTHPSDNAEQSQAAAEIEQEIDNIATSWQIALARKQVSAIDNAYEGLHRFYHLRARFHEGYEMFERAALVAQANGTAGSVLAAALATRQAYFMFRLDRPDEAQSVAQRSLDDLRRLQPQHISQDCTHHKVDQEIIFNTQLLGTLTWGAGDFRAARQLWQQALEQHQKADNHAQVVRAQNNVAVLAIETGDLGHAKALLEQSLHTKRSQNDWGGVAFALENLANVAFLCDDLFEARRMRLEALEIFQSLNDAVGMLRSQTHLGYLAYLLHEYDNALSVLNEALSLARQQRIGFGISQVLCNLSLVHGARGELEECQACLRNALQNSLQHHDPPVKMVIASAAVLAAKQGQAAASAAWGEWAQQQPLANIDIKRRVGLAAERWASYLSPEMIVVAQARGRACTLEQIVDEVMAWLAA